MEQFHELGEGDQTMFSGLQGLLSESHPQKHQNEFQLLQQKYNELEEENHQLKQQLSRLTKQLYRAEKAQQKLVKKQSKLDQREQELKTQELLVQDLMEVKIRQEQEHESKLVAEQLMIEQQLELQHRAETMTTYPCQICFTDVEPSLVFWYDGCDHEDRFCLSCMSQYSKSQVNEGNTQITCPASGCDNTLGFDAVSFLLQDAELMAKYEKFLYQHVLESFSDIIHCSSAKCSMPVPVADGAKTATCLGCKTVTCRHCLEGEHPGVSCEEFKEWKKKNGHLSEEELRFDIWKSKNDTRPCPKCKHIVTKTGCNKVTCTGRCKVVFCWLCGKTGIGYDHFDGGKCRQ